MLLKHSQNMVKKDQLCIVREQNMQQNDSESRRNHFWSNTLVPEIAFFTTTTFCRKTGTKLVQSWYKIGTITNFPILSSSKKLIHHQFSSVPISNENDTTLQSLIPKLVLKKVPIRYPTPAGLHLTYLLIWYFDWLPGLGTIFLALNVSLICSSSYWIFVNQ